VPLATRLSLFFLGALAAVLAGFSLALYALAHAHLHRGASDRLQAALNTLAAVAEVEPDGVEWETHDRRLVIGPAGAEAPRWVVTDGQGQRVDGSGDTEVERSLAGLRLAGGTPPQAAGTIRAGGETWNLERQWFRPGPPARGFKGGEAHQEPGRKKYPALVITVAVPLGPVRATLHRLAAVLTALSLGVWLAAALGGRWLSRRALRPLTRMAEAARTITAADLGRRLPGAGTGDELEDLGRAFNELLGRLQESFERQRRFTGDASHQLRTPLTAMLGQVEVALRRDRDPEEYRRVLGLVRGQAGQLRQVVEMLLFLARADAEAWAPELERIDLGEWLARHLLSWAAHPRAADLRTEPGPGQPLWVRAHPPLLGQALDNLLDNAFKYSGPGSAVTLRLRPGPDSVGLEVEDAGQGIAAEDLPHVFEPFYRSPHSRRLGKGGVGLGLAVAARVVNAFGGRIEVSSAPGKGSRFTVWLPPANPERAEAAGSAGPSGPTRGAPAGRP
jgi:signal transduction histidine kinase